MNVFINECVINEDICLHRRHINNITAYNVVTIANAGRETFELLLNLCNNKIATHYCNN